LHTYEALFAAGEPSMIQAVFFDLYGTLVEVTTNEKALPPYERLAEWLSDRKIRAEPSALLNSYTSSIEKLTAAQSEPEGEIDMAQVFKAMLVSCGVAKPTPALVTEFATAFRRFTRTRCALVPGANDLITRLSKDYRLGIIADAQKLFTTAELEELRMVEPFESVTLSSEVGFKKPSSRLFEVGLQAMEVAPDEAIYVGDGLKEDVVGAQKVGMKVVWFNPTNAAASDGIKADATVKRLSEVSKFVDEWQEPMETPLVDEILDDDE
jgi:putative hydrolase of the HAD superfamily